MQPKIKPPVEDQKQKTVKLPDKKIENQEVNVKEEIIKKPNIAPPVGAEPPKNISKTQPVGAGRGKSTTTTIEV